MIVVVAKRWFYAGSSIGPFVIIRESNYNMELLNHEVIHASQQKELLYVFAPLFYSLEFFIKLLYYRNTRKAYEAVSFEREARIFQKITGYVSYRKPFTFVKYIFWKPKTMLTVDFNSDADTFTSLYALPVGSVFKYTTNLETLLRTIQANKPAGKTFEVRTVNPGTNLYTLYGHSSLYVSKNEATP